MPTELDVRDQNKYATTKSSYPPTVIGEPNEDDSVIPTLEDVKTDADSTKQIAGPDRRTVTPIDIGAFLAALSNPVVRRGAVGQVLMGYSTRELAGAVARFNIRKGDILGMRVASISLVANGALNPWFGPDGIDMEEGIVVEWVVGSVDLILYIAHE